MEKLTFILTIVLWLFISNAFVDFDVCFKSLYFDSVRCIRGAYEVLNYNTLINAIEEGKRLIPQTGNIIVESPEGSRNLKYLNSITSHYQGPEALYWLAMDLEYAIKEGYIEWKNSFHRFDSMRLNSLPEDFVRKMEVEKIRMSWKKFFRFRRVLKNKSDIYKGNEGQIKFAFEFNIKELDKLFDTFSYISDDLGWNRLNFSMSNLKMAKSLFEESPENYIFYEGMRKLADKANLSHPRILYYAREEFQGYSQSKHCWRKNVLSVEEKEFVDKWQGYFDEQGLVVDVLTSLRSVGFERVFQVLDILESDEKFILNYVKIEKMIENCYKIYGSEAKGISVNDKITLRDYLHALDARVGDIFKKLNGLIFTCILESDTGEIDVAKRGQKDLILLLEILSDFKDDRLIGIDRYSHSYVFSNSDNNYKSIVLELHDHKTGMSQASIRWTIEKLNGDIISLRLDRDEGRYHNVCLDIVSPSLKEIFRIVDRQSTYHFNLGIPELNSDAIFKALVRIFY